MTTLATSFNITNILSNFTPYLYHEYDNLLYSTYIFDIFMLFCVNYFLIMPVCFRFTLYKQQINAMKHIHMLNSDITTCESEIEELHHQIDFLNSGDTMKKAIVMYTLQYNTYKLEKLIQQLTENHKTFINSISNVLTNDKRSCVKLTMINSLMNVTDNYTDTDTDTDSDTTDSDTDSDTDNKTNTYDLRSRSITRS